jgi:DNA-binding MarR family transcriptional regulator
VYTLNARFRIGPSGNVVVSRDMLAGAVKAAATPVTKRAAISRPGLLTRPPKSETRAKTARATRKTRLQRLTESDGRKFRPQDLAEAVHLSQSALSRLVDRLARHGLVERCGCDEDRRGVYVVLTGAGQRRHAEAVPTHRGVLARHLPASMLSAASSGR